MRVLNAGQNYWLRGGSDRCLLELERLLLARGHEVAPFSAQHPRNRPTTWSRFFPPGADVEQPRARDVPRFIYSPAASQALERLLDVFPADVAHLHIYYGRLTSAVLGPLVRREIPIVQTLHDYKLICPVSTLISQGRPCEACGPGHFWQAAVRRCNRGSVARSTASAVEAYVARAVGARSAVRQFIAVSEFVRQKMVSHGVSADRVTTVHNFIDATDLVPETKPGELVLYLGRLERTKGVGTLVAAAGQLPDVRFVLAGEGQSRPELEAMVARLGLHNVSFAGFCDARSLAALVGRAVCVVLPSEWLEPFGLTLLEANARGRPVVASRVGAIPEIVVDGETGFLITPGSVVELAARIRELVENPGRAREMGRAGRERVESLFGPERHYQSILEVYRRAGVQVPTHAIVGAGA